MTASRPGPALFRRGSWAETRRVGDILRRETVGGTLLLVAAVAALVWANVDGSSYAELRDTVVGPEPLHLDLTLGTWAADGLLAVFFFVAGLELKRELVAGDLRDPGRAALPVVAAMGGMAVPAGLYVLVNLVNRGDGEALRGWAVPTATDIAFALAVLAVIGSHLPSALRTFLLTLAVVDDLLAITIIAVFYTDTLHVGWLLAALVPLAAFTALVQRQVRSWYLLLPLAAATWVLVHASGVHATVAGVLLGFAVPVLRPGRDSDRDDDAGGPGLAEQLEHRWRPVSAGFAVPVFAFFAAGVTVGGLDGLRAAFDDGVTLGIVVGLVAGKTIGVLGSAYVVARYTRADLDEDLTWTDVLGVAVLAGIGFTVALLIGELAFGSGTERDDHAKVGILAASVLAGLVASVLLRRRVVAYRRIEELEQVDADHDGVPDVFQRDA